MLPFAKRTRFSDLINVSYDAAFEILTKIEVRDALSLTIAVANDARFKAFRAVMQSDDVWRFWTLRDLSVVVNAFGSLQKMEFNVDDRPRWKVIYLWYRLFVSALQWNIVNRIDFGDVFQDGDWWEYAYLNKVRVNGQLVDFEPLFVQYADRPYTLEAFQGEISYESFLMTHLGLSVLATRVYEGILKAMDRMIDDTPTTEFLYNYRDEIRTFPRELQEKRIFVTAQCPSCGKVYSIKNT